MLTQRSEEREEDTRTIMYIIILFVAVLVGRELGNLYNMHQEVSRLSVYLELEEEEAARYLRGILNGLDSELKVGLGLSTTLASSVGGPVTQTPEYVRRWLISVILSPITVQQPEISDLEVNLYLEESLVAGGFFGFGREKVSSIRLLERRIPLLVKDKATLKGLILEASERHGGEVEVKIIGRALVHIAFLNAWLPFSTTRYPLIRIPHLNYISSGWMDLEGRGIESLKVGETCYIAVTLYNPARFHTIWENLTARIYRVEEIEPIATIEKTVGVAAETRATYFLPFTPTREGVYIYLLEAQGGFSIGSDKTPPLEVRRP
ncbi:hypothetical protein KEJ49_06495 [Candidatus Bathyarchaeota archaeon]|nr:hypothetical protein [Candidatus Bathyarchaeota archaeon]